MERIPGTAALRPTGEIRCGWCGYPTQRAKCRECGRDPALPYVQRGQEPPGVAQLTAGRPVLDRRAIRAKLAEAAAAGAVTVEQTAEALGVSARTVRRWRAL